MTYRRVSSVLVRDVGEHTDDEVDLRSEVKREILVAHKLVHLDLLDDTKLGNALSVKLILICKYE